MIIVVRRIKIQRIGIVTIIFIFSSTTHYEKRKLKNSEYRCVESRSLIDMGLYDLQMTPQFVHLTLKINMTKLLTIEKIQFDPGLAVYDEQRNMLLNI